jgi:aminomethyltransferase
VAVQGPRVKEFIGQCIAGESNCAMRADRVTNLKKNEIGGYPFRGGDILVSRTGYTGEDGFEIIGRDDSIRQIWDTLLEVGGPFGLKPCGLGARDTLRTEVCYPLYGHELDEDTTPIEAGLGFFVAFDKGEFMGGAVLSEQKAHGVKKRLIAFKMAGKSAPPRPHYPIWTEGARIGEVTSGTQSPSLGIGIGLGYVPPESARPGASIEIEIRDKRSPALVVKKPIYQRA